MEKVYCIDKSLYASSEIAVKDILLRDYQIFDAVILRNTNGKPYLKNEQASSLFFSITHTQKKIFIVFSDENIGIDAESLSRKVHYSAIIKNFSSVEKEEISSTKDFLKHWTAKECTIKWLGGSISKDLKKLSYTHQIMRYEDSDLPINIIFLEHNNTLLAICSSKQNLKLKIVHLL